MNNTNEPDLGTPATMFMEMEIETGAERRETEQQQYLRREREEYQNREDQSASWEDMMRNNTEESRRREDEEGSTRSANRARRDGVEQPKPNGPLWGEAMRQGHSQCRLLLQNVNGISAKHAYSEARELSKSLLDAEVQIACFTETNSDWRARGAKRECTEALRTQFTETAVHMSSSNERFGTRYQPGGTCMMVREPWAARARKAGDDGEIGSWSAMTIEGRRKTAITVITAYRVVKTQIEKAGPFTAYSQQWHTLRRLHRTKEPNPRKEVLDRLQLLITEKRQQGHGIILAMDANESLQRLNCEFANWVRESGLVDIHTFRLGTEEEPPTYARGK
jgi:hypothetical protein